MENKTNPTVRNNVPHLCSVTGTKQIDLIRAGLSPNTAKAWVKGTTKRYFDGDSLTVLAAYFGERMNQRITMDDLVTLVYPVAPASDAAGGE